MNKPLNRKQYALWIAPALALGVYFWLDFTNSVGIAFFSPELILIFFYLLWVIGRRLQDMGYSLWILIACINPVFFIGLLIAGLFTPSDSLKQQQTSKKWWQPTWPALILLSVFILLLVIAYI